MDPKLCLPLAEALVAGTKLRYKEMTDHAYVQIFELWERADASVDKPCYYVKCIYNYGDLSLAHHSNGQLPATQHTLPSRLLSCSHFTYLPAIMRNETPLCADSPTPPSQMLCP